MCGAGALATQATRSNSADWPAIESIGCTKNIAKGNLLKVGMRRKWFDSERDFYGCGFHPRLLPVLSRHDGKAAMGRRVVLQGQDEDVCGAGARSCAADV